jgi:hypothetical protein
LCECSDSVIVVKFTALVDKILTALLEDTAALEDRRVEQIVAICGNGILGDSSSCSGSFREFLKNVSSRILRKYAAECLDGGSRTPNTGLILQDVVNEIGDRLGFAVEPGYYRGSPNRIGNDGVWRAKAFAFLLEVKTSDLSIKLDSIARYREKLIETNSLTEDESSILIVLGRQDTGDLEAQIRGSKHAWDVRMIGLDSLLRLLEIKESLNDPRSLHQITELLKPIEYTRVDKLIDVVFHTSLDVSTPENPDSPEAVELHVAADQSGIDRRDQAGRSAGTHSSPVNFYEKCIARINRALDKNLIKNGRVAYTSSDKTTNVVLLNSKSYPEANGRGFWYGFRPNQEEFLSQTDSAFVAFGCGSEKSILLIPFSRFREFLPRLGTTPSPDGGITHSHVIISHEDSRYSLKLGDEYVDVTEFEV